MIKFEFDVCDFDPEQIFKCGQCFRWEKQKDASYIGIVKDRYARVYLENADDFSGRLIIEDASPLSDREFWENYFDLKRDYLKIKKHLSARDEKIGKAILFGEGIRILKQDVFETIISFIISQNSNIPRIKKCINAISKEFGKKISSENGDEFYAFPTIEELANATSDELKALKLGYRAEYITGTTNKIRQNIAEFDKLCDMKYDDAREFLLTLPGVGPKVADCILLFGLGKFGAFPIDVWVKRVMHEIYGFDLNDLKGMKAFAEKAFGEYGGIAQQYLFYYIRSVSKN